MTSIEATKILAAWRDVARKGDPAALRKHTYANAADIARASQETMAYLVTCMSKVADAELCNIVEKTATQRLGCVRFVT